MTQALKLIVIVALAAACSSSKPPERIQLEAPADAGKHTGPTTDVNAISDDSDAGPVLSSGSSAAKKFATDLAEAEQARFTRCCESIGLDGPSEPVEQPLPSPRLGSHFDPAAAKKCIEQTAALPCELQKEAHPIAPACRSVFTRGHQRIGEPCTNEFECAQPEGKITGCIEREVDHKLMRLCTVVIEASEGDACMSDDPDEWIDCPSPLICDLDQNLCTAPAKLGKPCFVNPSYGDTCEIGAVCDRADTHTCIKPSAVGRPCQKVDECESLACESEVCLKPLFAVPRCEQN
jgi:hypothetical protein